MPIKMRAVQRTLKDLPRWKSALREVDLRSNNPAAALMPGEVALIALCRNNIDIVEPFLAHYRELGVDRFIMVDDQSTDGTFEFLSEQPDIDLHVSDMRYSQAARGRIWREMLLQRYGRNRWFLNVDIDEFLLFPSHYGTTIRSLIEALEMLGEKHLWAPMIDMVPDVARNFDADKLNQPDRFSSLDEMFAVCPYFDRSGYQWIVKTRQMHLLGGSRLRIFNQTFELTKYPLLYVDRFTNLGFSIHTPMPYWRNIVPPRAFLAHFKYMPGFLARTRDAVADGQYYDGAAFYREALENLENRDLDWIDPDISVRFENADQLAKLGFVK